MLGSRLVPTPVRRFARLTVDLRPARPQRGDLSQNGEYSYLRWLIPDGWPRTLVDVGANDGLLYSNSRNLLLDGWRGVLVEPHPATFAKLRANVADTEAVLFNCAASDQVGEAQLYDDTAAGATNLMATLSTEENDWYGKTRSDNSFTVTLRPLAELLEEAGFSQDFSLMSVDTEGHDASVLASLGDFRPRVILTERALRVPADCLRKQALLTGMGYVVVDRIGCNEVYVHQDHLLAIPQILN